MMGICMRIGPCMWWMEKKRSRLVAEGAGSVYFDGIIVKGRDHEEELAFSTAELAGQVKRTL